MHALLLILLAAAVIACLVAAAVAAVLILRIYRMGVHPQRGEFDFPRIGEGLPREKVRFSSRDGTSLAAWFIAGSRRQAVLLLHGYSSCKDDMLSHAAFLHDAGYSLLLLDLRACGESGGQAVTLGAKEREDVQCAIEYLQSRDDVDHGAIGVLGLSLGASLAILAACDSPVVRAVVAESAFRSARAAIRHNFHHFTRLPAFPCAPLVTWIAERRQHVSLLRVAPEREVERLRRCALLLIHAHDDTIIPISHSEAIYARAPEPKEFWPVPSALHAMAFNTLKQEYVQRVVEFFDRWLAAENQSGQAVH